jgi:hypothetical protein
MCDLTNPPVGLDIDGYEPLDLDDLDAGIRRAVEVLRAHGVETFESCEGGGAHAYPEPTVRFHGNDGAGWKALGVLIDYGLPIGDLRRTWPYTYGAPTGPYWEVTFTRKIN